MKFLVDENMPRSLLKELVALNFDAEDVRDVGLLGHPDEEVFEFATASDAIIITRDHGFTYIRNWPADFTAGVIFVNLPDDATTKQINSKVIALLTQRLPKSLLGAITTIEQQRSLSRTVRRRP